MKTLKGWMKTEDNFKDYVQPGDEVDEAMVDHFMNALPPRNLSYGYMQCGEPISQDKDKNGKLKTTWLTFEKEGGRWIYRGCCFAGETEDHSIKKGDPWV